MTKAITGIVLVGAGNQNRLGSFAGSEPDFANDIPANLSQVRALQLPFNHARSPEISAQIKDLNKSEKQRREEGQQGSTMVKQDSPYPELRPKHELEPKRASFNQAWLKEYREAMLKQYQSEYVSNPKMKEKISEIPSLTPSRTR